MKEFLNGLDDNVEVNPLIFEFTDDEVGEEYRYAYAEEHLNTWIALQIKTLREQRGLKQSDLAERIGTQQPAIARLENANYSKWKTETLRKIARALGVRLKITFETFGTLLDEDSTLSREKLQRPHFKDDPMFHAAPAAPSDTDEVSRAALKSVPPTDAGFVAVNTLPQVNTVRGAKQVKAKRRSHGRKRVA